MPQIIYVMRRIQDGQEKYQEAVAYYSKETTAHNDANMANKSLQQANIDNIHYHVAPIVLIED